MFAFAENAVRLSIGFDMANFKKLYNEKLKGQIQKELGLKNLVPDAVCAMIMACLAKDPEKRPPSAVSVEEWISEGATAQALPAVETRVASSSLPNIPDNADHLPSQDTQPSVPPISSKASVGVDEAAHADTHTPGNQPVASAKWAQLSRATIQHGRNSTMRSPSLSCSCLYP